MASKYRKKFELPEGFYEILEDYSKEVLRDQPLDIVEFSYLYFKALEEVSGSLSPHVWHLLQVEMSGGVAVSHFKTYAQFRCFAGNN